MTVLPRAQEPTEPPAGLPPPLIPAGIEDARRPDDRSILDGERNKKKFPLLDCNGATDGEENSLSKCARLLKYEEVCLDSEKKHLRIPRCMTFDKRVRPHPLR